MVAAPAWDTFRVTQGTYYVFSIELLAQAPRLSQLGVQFYGGDALTPMQTYYGPSQTTSTSVWKTFEIVVRAPVGATSMVPLIFTYGNVDPTYHYAKSVMVHQGDRYVPPFSGEDPDDTDYQYAWTDAAHGSPSIRTPLSVRPDVEALIWRAGQSAMDLLLPLLQANGLRLVCDESRTWTLRDDSYSASGSQTATWATDIISGEDAIDRASDSFFTRAITEYTWTDRDGIRQRMIDAYGPTSSKARKFDKQDVAYPGPGYSQVAVTRAAKRGRQLTVTKTARWDARADQAITVTPYLTGVESGKIQTVTFDIGEDEMTLTTRDD